MVWDDPIGIGVDAVRTEIKNLRNGAGSFDALKSAVAAARFAVRPTARSIEDLAANWDYQPMDDTWTDTVQAALFDKTITKDQYDELQQSASFTGPEPSRA